MAPGGRVLISGDGNVFKGLVKRKSPEEQELEDKQHQLAELEEELSQRELDLATLTAELQSCEQLYMTVMGWRYAELDAIRAQIAKQRLESNPTSSQARTEYTRAKEQARASAESAGEHPREAAPERFTPPEELRKLYREVAKHVHPDLAVDDEDRAIRTRLMAQANEAYEQGDADRLRAILEQYEASPEAVRGETIGDKLIRLIRKIARVRQRLEAISEEIAALEATPIGQLYARARESGESVEWLLERLAKHVDEEIAGALEEWAQLVRKRGWR